MPLNMSMRILCSYSHRDERLRQDLEAHLAVLHRLLLVREIWTDRLILPGRDWQREIDEKLAEADLILLLVSAHFISSNYCYSIEMQKALDRHKRGEAIVIPIIARPCDWTSTPIGTLQALPQNGKPITEWKNRDAGWTDVVKSIRELIQTSFLSPQTVDDLAAQLTPTGAKSSTELSVEVVDLPTSGDAAMGLPVMHPSHYLTVDYDSGSKQRFVRLESDMLRVLGGVRPTATLSPIYPYRVDPQRLKAQYGAEGDYWLLLLGPINPHLVYGIDDPTLDVWVTIGSYNIILGIATREQAETLVEWARTRIVRFEMWFVSAGILQSMAAPPPPLPCEIDTEIANPDKQRENQQLLQEFLLLIKVSLARAAVSLPDFEPDIIAWYDAVALHLNSNADSRELATLIREITYGLTQLNLQALGPVATFGSGVLGVQYSLLGTGIANMALRKLYRFAADILHTAAIPECLEQLRQMPSTYVGRLEKESWDSSVWQKDYLSELTSQLNIPAEAYLPLIPIFDSRRGYQSSPVMISAPPSFIIGCNSFLEAPLTISHELVYNLVRAIISVLIPVDETEFADAFMRRVRSGPQTAFDAVQAYVFDALVRLAFFDSPSDEPELSLNDMRQILGDYHSEVEEIFTHTLDYLYFYGQDSEAYVKTCWYGWTQIPNIAHRIYDYLYRTLSAVMVSHLRRGVEAPRIAIQQVKLILASHNDFGDSGYTELALQLLENEARVLKERLHVTRRLLQVCQTFLYSPQVAEKLAHGSPFRFLWSFTSDSVRAAPTSAWLLNLLAFDQHTTERSPLVKHDDPVAVNCRS
ncbi:MAG TPA: toll/interleukin-1 receptor domain-containing protein [Longimicrobium sp.]